MNWSHLLFRLDGRISRRQFWIAALVLAAFEAIAHVLAHRLEGERLSAIVDLAFSCPEFAICVKRAQDRNMAIWVPGVFFAGAVLMDFLVVVGWGGHIDRPNALTLALILLWTFFGCILLVELGFRRGVKGPNRFGPDPLDARLKRRGDGRW